MARKLTDRQRLFAAEYLVDRCATAAYGRAGYKGTGHAAEAAASRLLKHPGVKALIDAGTAARIERTEVTQDYVLANLTEVVERCMQRAPVMVRRERAWVQETDDRGRNVWQFNAKSAVAALALLAQHLGMLKTRHEHTGPGGGPIEIRTIEAVKPADHGA